MASGEEKLEEESEEMVDEIDGRGGRKIGWKKIGRGNELTEATGGRKKKVLEGGVPTDKRTEEKWTFDFLWIKERKKRQSPIPLFAKASLC